jgi:flagellin-like hook-associated protein FlgL
MSIRVSTSSAFTRILFGLRVNQALLGRTQEMAASGRRILAPSDDPTGTTRAIALRHRASLSDRYLNSIESGLPIVDMSAAALQDGGDLLAEARTLLLQGMNGTLSAEDREALASQVELLRTQLVEIGNTKLTDRYLFAGTATDARPWEEAQLGPYARVLYRGNGEVQKLRIGEAADVGLNVPGDQLFGKSAPAGTSYSGLTGAAPGTSADLGTGYLYLDVRHDATDASALAAVGVASAGGGLADDFVGDETIVIDAAARTVQLGDGELVQLPPAGDPALADVAVANGLGGTIHLDFSAWTGADFSGSVSASASVSLDGSAWTPLDTASTDLELAEAATGSVIHVDATQIGRAGRDLVNFDGTVNAFDVLQGIVEDLRSDEGLTQAELLARLDKRLDELDRNHDNVVVGTGIYGSRSARLADGSQKAQDVGLQIAGMLAGTVDADYSEIAIELAQTELKLQMVQATAVRVINTSLVNLLT